MIKWMTGLVALSLSACATAPPETSSSTAPEQASAISSLPASGLGPQTLAAGECGLFLWSKTDISKFIFFSRANTGEALFANDETTIQLTQTGTGGEIFGQFQTRLSYKGDDGEQYALVLKAGDDLAGGQRIESGLFTITDGEGWQTKRPVLGVRACQSD